MYVYVCVCVCICACVCACMCVCVCVYMCIYIYMYIYIYVYIFSILSHTFGRSKFEKRKIAIILFLSFANDSNYSMLLWMITTTSCQNFSFLQLLFLTNIRF